MNKVIKEKANQKSNEKNHLMKSSWNLGKTATMRVPVVLKSRLMDVARHIDEGGEIKLANSVELKTDKESKTILSQDNITNAVTILERAITSKKKGGEYNSSNASPLRKEVIKALSILKEEISDA